MSYFPLCIDLAGQRVLLVGEGPQTAEKEQKLHAFQPCIVRLLSLTAEDLTPAPALVIAGDLEEADAQVCSRLCRARNIPVNVVDRPELCSFFFPALIRRGDLTVSVSTGGKSPAAGVYLRRQIEAMLPDRTEQILVWMEQLRCQIRHYGTAMQRREILSAAAREAFAQNRPLSEEETTRLLSRFGDPSVP